jgi:hypothetical protein
MLNRIILPLLRLTFFVLIVAALARPVTGCTKMNDKKNDSTDTVFHLRDSAKFFVDIDVWIYNTSGVFMDTFYDGGSLIIYVVNGVVRLDSILNLQPIAYPSSGDSANWQATWIPDKIGEINIVGGSGFVSTDDTTVVITLNQSGTVTPKWSVSFMHGTPSVAGGDAVPGWPPGFTFSLRQKSQRPFDLDQPGSIWTIWVYKDY